MVAWLLMILTVTLIVAHVALDLSRARRGPADADVLRSAAFVSAGLRGSFADDL